MIKPFRYRYDHIDFIILVYKSEHEEEDYLCIVREEKYKNDYIRVLAKSAQEAADLAWKRYLSIYKRI